MSEFDIALIAFGIVMLLIFLRVPVAIAMGLVGVLGYAIVTSWTGSTSLFVISTFTHSSSYALTVIPLFMIMGSFAQYGGLSAALYNAAYKWMGRLPGGLAMATVAACGAFAAMCGSSLATAVTIGRQAIPEMLKYNYDKKLATGCIASAGTLGILIPPSAAFVILGYITEQSIGKLLIAGILPGVLTIIVDMVGIYILVKLRPKLAPTPPVHFTNREKFGALRRAWGLPVAMAVVMGGIYTGVMTPTEAGAVAAFVTFIMFLTSPGRSLKNFNSSLLETGKTTSMLMLIILAAYLLGALLAYGNVPTVTAAFITGLTLPPHVVMGLILVLFIIMGCFLDGLAIIVITIPIIFPAVVGMGFNPIWFSVLVVKLIEIGQITPPFGMTVFAIHGVAPEVSLGDTFRGVSIFFVFEIITISILFAFPQISLFLPALMTG